MSVLEALLSDNCVLRFFVNCPIWEPLSLGTSGNFPKWKPVATRDVLPRLIPHVGDIYTKFCQGIQFHELFPLIRTEETQTRTGQACWRSSIPPPLSSAVKQSRQPVTSHRTIIIFFDQLGQLGLAGWWLSRHWTWPWGAPLLCLISGINSAGWVAWPCHSRLSPPGRQTPDLCVGQKSQWDNEMWQQQKIFWATWQWVQKDTCMQTEIWQTPVK